MTAAGDGAKDAGAREDTGGREDEAVPRVRRGRRTVAGVVVASCALALAAVWVSSVVRSPAQAAAEAGPPAADVLTAPVEHRTLSDTVVVRGTVSAAQTLDLAPVRGGEDAAGEPVVTRVLLRPGASFGAARPLVEVSGRPVYALRGTLPVYRDLKPGAHGDDIAQLQRALAEAGHGTGTDRSGTYGPGTKAAVAALYAALGYEPVVAGALPDGTDPLADARARVRDAERALAGVRGDGAKSGAEKGEGDKGGGTGDGADAERYAREDLALARTALARAEEATGPMIPAGELVFLSGFPARVDAATARAGDPASEGLMTVSAGKLVVRAAVGAEEKGLLRRGQKVRIVSEVSGDESGGTVASVADTPRTAEEASGAEKGSGGGARQDTGAGGAAGYAVVVNPAKPLPARLAGQDVRLTVEAASTEGKVLVVPVSALSAGADARTTVTVLDARGERRRVEVRPGTSGDGRTEVTPVGGGKLAAGDRVVIGAAPGAERTK